MIFLYSIYNSFNLSILLVLSKHNRKLLMNLSNNFKIDLTKFYLIEKKRIVLLCYYVGMLLVYFGSLHPWWLWPLKELYPIPAAGLLFIGYLISNSMNVGVFNRRDYLLPTFFYVLVMLYIMAVGDGDLNINAYITFFFTIIVIFVLMKSDVALLHKLTDVIAKSMAILLIPSIIAFFLYLVGFSLPSRNDTFGDNHYNFTNYYFFMIDDRFMMVLIPRFQAFFLEPGHLGSATTLLLMTQYGRWKRWWNVVLIVASVISFSLAAYAIIIVQMFLSMWVNREKIVRKVVYLIAFLGICGLTATLYNGGDNLVNNLILARLEVDDKTGEMVGNNRVDEGFEKEFDKYLTTTDVFFGRDMSRIASDSGNSGYRVFIYQNGLVGLFFLVLFYAFSFRKFTDWRYLVAVIVVSLLIFWIRGYPLWYSNFIPLFATAYREYNLSKSGICDPDVGHL